MPNRLADESSPYLLQHADNPVDWYPWSAEALDRARQEDKPIFLSIGYSACHWCHVMEHESFQDAAIAQVLNENFVCIKVDREERPDLDQIYMNAVMALRGGGGGWPLSVFLTPQQDVFFGGTYWPPRSRVGMPGFDHVLLRVLEAFQQRREEVNEQSRKITEWLNESTDASDGETAIRPALLTAAAEMLERSFDFENGGFGTAPKFPHSMDLQLLVRLSWPDLNEVDGMLNRDRLMHMVDLNLRKMTYGGIFDHLGGGFARYSVDEKWLVPHFEKMLYDNALLARVFAEMIAATGDEFYKSTCRKVLDYVLGYLADDAGAFHSTEDADSEGQEGKFYVWSRRQILDVLGDKVGKRFCRLYNVSEQGNFEGQNILNMTVSYGEFAARESMSKQELRDEMRDARTRLLEVRDRRVRPGRDDKILVNWNGLAISALARAAVVLEEPEYREAAIRAARFLWRELRTGDGRLLHTWRAGNAKLDAYLDDYAFLAAAMVELYEATFDSKWIDLAVQLVEMIETHFAHPEGGYYFTADDHEQLIARTRSFQDSSIPSGNSMAATVLLKLGRLTADTEYEDRARRTIVAALPLMQRSPLASGQMLLAVSELLGENQQIVIADEDRQVAREIAFRFRRQLPHAAIVLNGDASDNFRWAADKGPVDGQPTVYVCSGFQCHAPLVGECQIEQFLADAAS